MLLSTEPTLDSQSHSSLSLWLPALPLNEIQQLLPFISAIPFQHIGMRYDVEAPGERSLILNNMAGNNVTVFQFNFIVNNLHIWFDFYSLLSLWLEIEAGTGVAWRWGVVGWLVGGGEGTQMENGIINILWQLTFQSRSVAQSQYWRKMPDDNKTDEGEQKKRKVRALGFGTWRVPDWGCGRSNLINICVIGEVAGKEHRGVKKQKQRSNRCRGLPEKYCGKNNSIST